MRNKDKPSEESRMDPDQANRYALKRLKGITQSQGDAADDA